MQSRRSFLKTSAAAAAFAAAPNLLLSRRAHAANDRITIGMIGTGRQAAYINLPQFLELDGVQVVALCDVDAWRMNEMRKQVDEHYGGKGCDTYGDFRELLARDDIDAVMISTPDHWHVPAALAAVRAGKHISVEKPLSTCVAHGRLLADAVKKAGVANRTDSEFRSLPQFWKAVQAVRNGRIGKLTEMRTFAPDEPMLDEQPGEMPVPEELNYEMWLGPAPEAPYTEQRVHPQHKVMARPGWFRVSDYTNGMISNWGTHLNDIAQWGNNSERTGPVKVSGTGKFSEGLWDTIIDFDVNYEYADGVKLHYVMNKKPGIEFRGEDGWIRAMYPTGLEASDPAILEEAPGEGELDLSDTMTDKEDFIHAIRNGGETLEPIEVGHRTVSICQIGLISAKLGRPLEWDPEAERFKDDEEANALLDRPTRGDWLKG